MSSSSAYSANSRSDNSACPTRCATARPSITTSAASRLGWRATAAHPEHRWSRAAPPGELLQFVDEAGGLGFGEILRDLSARFLRQRVQVAALRPGAIPPPGSSPGVCVGSGSGGCAVMVTPAFSSRTTEEAFGRIATRMQSFLFLTKSHRAPPPSEHGGTPPTCPPKRQVRKGG